MGYMTFYVSASPVPPASCFSQNNLLCKTLLTCHLLQEGFLKLVATVPPAGCIALLTLFPAPANHESSEREEMSLTYYHNCSISWVTQEALDGYLLNEWETQWMISHSGHHPLRGAKHLTRCGRNVYLSFNIHSPFLDSNSGKHDRLTKDFISQPSLQLDMSCDWILTNRTRAKV